jgi:hypothetical protein
VAPFTLFDFQRRIRRTYKFLPRRRLPRAWRFVNRILLVVLLVWITTSLVRCFSDSGTPSTTGQPSTIKSLEATHGEEPSTSGNDDNIGEESEEDTGEAADSAPISDVSDPNAESAAPEKFEPNYQRDTILGQKINQVLAQYRPYAAFVLMVDLGSNEILAWGQRTDSTQQSEPTWLSKSSFPAASLIKMVTSTAALESGRYGSDTPIPLIGRSVTLYSRQLRVPENYKGPTITLLDAFAKSCNPAMGFIGKHLGGRTLRKYGMRMGFERPWPNGTPQPSRFSPPDTGFALAEAASGFTRVNTVSPLHMAAIVRALIKKEPLQMPWSHTIPPQFAPRESLPLGNSEFSPDTYFSMRELFLRTVSHGTARKWMRRTLYSQNHDALWIGGKTGSLDGVDPTGRYDWFAGFAQSKKQSNKGVVILVMQVHNKIRTLPSPAVAGLLINTWTKRLGPPPKK